MERKEQKDQPENKIARRSFLSGLGLAAVAGVATKISTTTPAVTDIVAAASEPEGDSYRLTEHIKKYYRTTAI